MSVWDWIIGILLFIVGLGVLIALHELGHLIMAKIFNVFCSEYSIGFGPKLFSVKPKNKETKFSLRAFPVGGYVAMYGEDSKDDEAFKDIPPERSLEGVAKWKRALIYVGGVTINFILGIILILTSNIAFPKYANSGFTYKAEDNVAHLETRFKEDSPVLVSYPALKNDGEDFLELYEVSSGNSSYYIAADNIEIADQPYKYVMVVNSLYKTTSAPSFVGGVSFYIQSEETVDLIANGTTFSAKEKIHLPDLEAKNPMYTPNVETSINVNVNFMRNDVIINADLTINTKQNGNKFYYKDDLGMNFVLIEKYLNFGQAWTTSFKQYGTLFVEIIKAIGGLFTGESFQNVGGVVAIAASISEYNANYGFGMFLFYMGFLSINLGIFNLLPFPGLDGWALLVLAIEAIFRKKVPQKVKGIISTIGLILLFGLMIVILVKDIIGLVI